MMRVAICDDARLYTARLELQLKELATESEIEIEIETFRSFLHLQSAMKEKKYDLLLLETSVRGVNGIDFARSLRQQKYDGEIIFVSLTSEAAFAAYSVFPIGYLLKPTEKRKLRAPFRRAAEKHTKRKSIVFTCADGGRVSLNVDDILYVEVIGIELSVHCRLGNFKCIGSLTDTFEKLPAGQFYRSHRSYIVNMNCIVRSAKYYFVLDNGDKVTIAKNRYAEAKQKLVEFCGE